MMRFILKNRKVILPLITGVFLPLCLLTGCKEKAPPTQPAVVKKRVEQAPRTTAVNKTQVEPASEAIQPEAEKKGEPAVESSPKKSATADVKADASPLETAQTESTGAPDTGGEETTAGEQSLKARFMDDSIPKYDPTGKIDPFASLFSQKNAEGASKDTTPKRPLTPLEKIDISQLHLTAVVQGPSGNRAMVEDATGKGYILTPGTFIGVNSGIVTEILADRVIIEEKTRDVFGKEKTSIKELKIQKPLGEE